MDTLHINDVDIAYDERGTGEPVAFVNGVMMTCASWKLQTDVISQSYRCLLHDTRGQLLSGTSDGPYTMAQHAEDLYQLLRTRGIDKLHLVGTSYGGEIAMLFSALHPEMVASLTVIASVSHSEQPLRDTIKRWMEAAKTPETLYRATLADNYSPAYLAANAARLAQWEKVVSGRDPVFFEQLIKLCQCFLDMDLRDILPTIQAPTLVMVGDQDTLKLPTYSEYLAEHIPNAALRLIPGAGHAVVVEQPKPINQAILAFLEQHPIKETP